MDTDPSQRNRVLWPVASIVCFVLLIAGPRCARPTYTTEEIASTEPSTQPAREPLQSASAPAEPLASQPIYDTTRPKPVAPRDELERQAQNREGGLRLVDRLMDRHTEPPAFERKPLPQLPEKGEIGPGIGFLNDRNPFPEIVPLPHNDVTIRVGLARSTYRTREPEEVLSAVQPFIDLEQREVNIRGAPDIYQSDEDLYNALLDGRDQMMVSHVFDYLRLRDWLATQKDNGAVLLATAHPAHPRTGTLDRDFAGTPGTSIELIVAADSPFKQPADLKGGKLALTANAIHGPGAFLTRVLTDLGQPRGAAFFSQVTLRRYSKDTVIDVLKGKADAACVDQGTVGALCRLYGIESKIRTIGVSPRYNVDVLYTSLNNIATHRTEIELTQRQLTTLGKDPEGQEVLFFFDVEGWHNYREDDIAVPRQSYDDYLEFINNTPADLRALRDPKAPVDRRTYDRYGDE